MTQTQQREQPTLKELNGFKMFTDAPGGANKRSILTWGIMGINPRITVNTNVEEDKKNKYGMIHAGMNPETFFILLDSIIHIAEKEEPGYKQKLECKTTTRLENGGRSEPFLNSEVWVGKDKEGVMWISLVAENRPKIIFPFKLSDFHSFTKAGNIPLTESEASCLQAIGTMKALKKIYMEADMCGSIRTINFGKKDVDEGFKQEKAPSGKSSSDYSKFDSMDDISM